MNYKEAAHDFYVNQKQFQLGVIPTEQSNPLTKNLSQTIARDTIEGVKTIFSADVNIPKVAAKAFRSKVFNNLVNDIKRCMDEKKQVVFSSVGASGRMAIQLDAGWREFWQTLGDKIPARAKEFLEIAEVTNSFTTGGDRALICAVENFEDYMTFGAQQVVEANIGKGDVLVGLSECGLSASINGSVLEAQKEGCTTYYLYCNPKDILCEHLDRVRVVFENKKIIKMPLYVGNMAVAGSTRMQVTTIELLVAGAALELAAQKWLEENLTEDELKAVGPIALEPQEYAKQFKKMSKQLSSGKAVAGIAQAIEEEKKIYDQKGLLTYLTHYCFLDILTDTTERQPTFTLPPFRQFNDHESPVSWAYIKDPLYPNKIAWQHIFRRPIKGLDWGREDYIRMEAAQDIIDNPPKVGSDQIELFNIGNEDDPSRYERKPSRLICMDINGSANEQVMKYFNENVTKFTDGLLIRWGDIPKGKLYKNEIKIPVKLPQTCTNLFTHLMIKVAFNCISTGTMAKMGRVWGNWMIQVLPTNKKLIDRSTRIIANIAGIPYEEALEEFYKSYLGRDPKEQYRESYVVETLKRLGKNPTDDIK